jgi:hypothetical protein
MWNFVPRLDPAYSLLFGKRPLQRVVVGSKSQQIEIPLNVVQDIPSKCDSSATYIGNKYVSMDWNSFIKIKTDAHNLIHSNVKSALTNVNWFPKVKALVEGKTAQTHASLLSQIAAKSARPKYPIAQ